MGSCGPAKSRSAAMNCAVNKRAAEDSRGCRKTGCCLAAAARRSGHRWNYLDDCCCSSASIPKAHCCRHGDRRCPPKADDH